MLNLKALIQSNDLVEFHMNIDIPSEEEIAARKAKFDAPLRELERRNLIGDLGAATCRMIAKYVLERDDGHFVENGCRNNANVLKAYEHAYNFNYMNLLKRHRDEKMSLGSYSI